jgi:hypothetical protein
VCAHGFVFLCLCSVHTGVSVLWTLVTILGLQIQGEIKEETKSGNKWGRGRWGTVLGQKRHMDGGRSGWTRNHLLWVANSQLVTSQAMQLTPCMAMGYSGARAGAGNTLLVLVLVLPLLWMWWSRSVLGDPQRQIPGRSDPMREHVACCDPAAPRRSLLGRVNHLIQITESFPLSFPF